MQHRRSPGIRGQLSRFAPPPVGVEDEPPLVMALEQHHPNRGHGVAVGGRQRHLLGVAHARLCRLGEPVRRTGRGDRGRGRRDPPCESSHPALRYAPVVAATKAIEIRTAIPGPRSRELLVRGETLDREALAGLLAGVRGRGPELDDHGCRRQHVHRLRGWRRRLQRGPLPSTRRRGDPGAGGEVRPHRFHGRALRVVHRARRAARSRSSRSPARRGRRSSTPARRPSRTPSRSRGSRPAVPP